MKLSKSTRDRLTAWWEHRPTGRPCILATSPCGDPGPAPAPDDYWTKPATYDFGQTRRVVVDLQQMKDTDGNRVDPSHLYIVGFWSTGGKPIVISSMKLE